MQQLLCHLFSGLNTKLNSGLQKCWKRQHCTLSCSYSESLNLERWLAVSNQLCYGKTLALLDLEPS